MEQGLITWIPIPMAREIAWIMLEENEELAKKVHDLAYDKCYASGMINLVEI